MEKLGAEVIAVAASEEGSFLLARRKFDAVVLDYDDHAVPGICRLLQEIRRGTSNRSTIVFALIGDKTASRLALAGGANFVLQKPLGSDRVERAFRSALKLMRRENRRYFRLAIVLPVTLELEDGSVHGTTTMNLSKKGLALRECPLTAGTRARIRISTPGAPPIGCEVEVAWTAGAGSGTAGLQILAMEERDREALAALIDRAAEEAEHTSLRGDRQRSVRSIRRSLWWRHLGRRILRSVRRLARTK
jgi:CheY-like chemotaxis protein